MNYSNREPFEVRIQQSYFPLNKKLEFNTILENDPMFTRESIMNDENSSL